MVPVKPLGKLRLGVNIDHVAGLAQDSGTIAFKFSVVNPYDGYQALFSKDASGQEGGGHLTAWIDYEGHLKVRYQSAEQTLYFRNDDFHVEAGETYQFAFSFDPGSA